MESACDMSAKAVFKREKKTSALFFLSFSFLLTSNYNDHLFLL